MSASFERIISLIVGSLLILANSYWIWYSCRLIYIYEFTDVDVFIRIPIWLIILNILGSIVGLFIGIKTIQGKIPALKAIGLNALIGIFLFAVELLLVSN